MLLLRVLSLAALFAVATLPGRAFGMTLAEAMDRAANNSEAALLFSLQEQELRGGERAAMGALLPTLSTRGTMTRNDQEIRIGDRIFTQLWDFQATVSGNVDIFRPQAIPAYRDASLRAEAARFRTRSEQGVLRREAARLYLLVFTARENLAAARRNILVAEESLQQTSGRFEAGFATLADVAQAELALARAQNAELEAELVLDDGLAELAWLVRTDALDPTTLERPSIRAATSPSERIAAFRALDLEADAAMWRRRQQRWSVLPTVTLGANYFIGRESLRAPDGVYWQMTMALEWMLFDFSRYGQIDAARAAEQAAMVRVEQAERQRDWEVDRAERQGRRAYERVGLSRRALDVARRNRELVGVRYELGEATALELVQADAEVFVAETDVNLADLEVELAAVELAWLRGTLDGPAPMDER